MLGGKHFANYMFFITAFSFVSLSFAGITDFDYNMDEVYLIAPDGSITLITSDAEITVTGSDREDAHVEVHYRYKASGLGVFKDFEPFEMEVNQDGKNLYLRETGGGSTLIIAGFSVRSVILYEIRIEAPYGVSLKLRGDDDNYNISNIAGSINLRFDDGSAKIKNCTAKECEIEFEDGEVELFEAEGDLIMDFEDGSFLADNCNFNNIDAACEDGSIEIETYLQNDGLYRLKNEDGRIRFTVLGGGGDFRVSYDDGRVITSSAFNVIEKDEGFTHIKLPGSNAKIYLNTEDGRIRLLSK